MKRYKIKIPSKTKDETASAIIKKAMECFEMATARKPTAFEFEKLLGGDRCHWGRILKGVAAAKGPYLARLKVLTVFGRGAQEVFDLAGEQRFGHVNRKGNMVVHIKSVWDYINGELVQDRAQDAYYSEIHDSMIFSV